MRMELEQGSTKSYQSFAGFGVQYRMGLEGYARIDWYRGYKDIGQWTLFHLPKHA